MANGLAYAHLYWLQIQFDGPAAAAACRRRNIYTHMFVRLQEQQTVVHNSQSIDEGGERGVACSILIVACYFVPVLFGSLELR